MIDKCDDISELADQETATPCRKRIEEENRRRLLEIAASVYRYISC